MSILRGAQRARELAFFWCSLRHARQKFSKTSCIINLDSKVSSKITLGIFFLCEAAHHMRVRAKIRTRIFCA